jgi:ATP-dependent Lon protease
LHIVERHLVPKQREQHGLKDEELHITKPALMDAIRYYTREAGVRGLEREVAKLCRKVVKELSLNKRIQRKEISARNLGQYLGVRRYRYGNAETKNEVGQVTGLAWTEVGGELLQIETAVVPGKGKLQQTGQLGDVMRESVHAAITVVRSRSAMLGIAADFLQTADIHIHVPEGATPKDGPSAGIAMCTAVVSALAKIPVCADVAMTGEITLRGKVLPIGGLKEKLLAAHRGGIRTVIIPEDNRKDLVEIPKNIRDALAIHPVSWIDEVLDIALAEKPKPLPNDDSAGATASHSGSGSKAEIRPH